MITGGQENTNLSTTLPPFSQKIRESEVILPGDISSENQISRNQLDKIYNRPGMGGMWQPFQEGFAEVNGHYILATGLTEFIPGEFNQVIEALTIANDNIMKVLQYENYLPHPLMVMYFGYNYEEFTGNIFNAWHRLKEMIGVYMTEYPGYGKSRRVTNKEDTP